ncbi:hypothetical protein PAXRUDRAFT_13519 [Paxillus rubicundulus Ve08.2h10]|uniref:Uncharacterized protein n=1 Tax=Paxillus rubicundulus Ve08.2h10 TaxID=930991 RepID=A0A0D0D5J3_9AGAM|nr:hypothetical protein PAXRUDRAFT_13519 [Paxillus rubicundulus Ve08.2h10]
MNTVMDDKKAANAQKQKSKNILDEKGVSDKAESQSNRACGNFEASKASNVKEVWFAGGHSDAYVYIPRFRDCTSTPPGFKWWKKRIWTVFARGHRFAHVDAHSLDLDFGTSNPTSRVESLRVLPDQASSIVVRSWRTCSKVGPSERSIGLPDYIVNFDVAPLFASSPVRRFTPPSYSQTRTDAGGIWEKRSSSQLDGSVRLVMDWTMKGGEGPFRLHRCPGTRSSRRAPLRYLDRSLFVLRLSGFPTFTSVCPGYGVCISGEDRNCVRGEDRWQETFEKVIRSNFVDIVKLVAIVTYHEASVDEGTVSKGVEKEVTSPKHVINQVSGDVLKNVQTCLQDHEALRKSIPTADVIKTFMALRDHVLRYPGKPSSILCPARVLIDVQRIQKSRFFSAADPH